MEPFFAEKKDIASWMKLVRQIRGDFPGLETEMSLDAHEQTVLRFMAKRQALCVWEADEIIGALLFSRRQNRICFLAVSPEHRREGAASILLEKALAQLDRKREITVSTFRQDDEKGLSPRALYRKFGFTEGALTEEFDYPNQVFVLSPQTPNQ